MTRQQTQHAELVQLRYEVIAVSRAVDELLVLFDEHCQDVDLGRLPELLGRHLGHMTGTLERLTGLVEQVSPLMGR